MKSLLLILWTVAAAVASVGWTAAGEDDQEAVYKTELEKFAGTWLLVACEKDGVKAPEADPRQMKHIITGDKLTLELAGKTVQEGWICIDPTRKVVAVHAEVRRSLGDPPGVCQRTRAGESSVDSQGPVAGQLAVRRRL